jgi:hypothetical protein
MWIAGSIVYTVSHVELLGRFDTECYAVRSDFHLAYDAKLWTFVPRKDVLDRIFSALLLLVGDNRKFHSMDQARCYALANLCIIFTIFTDYPTIWP